MAWWAAQVLAVGLSLQDVSSLMASGMRKPSRRKGWQPQMLGSPADCIYCHCWEATGLEQGQQLALMGIPVRCCIAHAQGLAVPLLQSDVALHMPAEGAQSDRCQTQDWPGRAGRCGPLHLSLAAALPARYVGLCAAERWLSSPLGACTWSSSAVGRQACRRCTSGRGHGRSSGPQVGAAQGQRVRFFAESGQLALKGVHAKLNSVSSCQIPLPLVRMCADM